MEIKHWNLDQIIQSLEHKRITDKENFMWMHELFLALAREIEKLKTNEVDE